MQSTNGIDATFHRCLATFDKTRSTASLQRIQKLIEFVTSPKTRSPVAYDTMNDTIKTLIKNKELSIAVDAMVSFPFQTLEVVAQIFSKLPPIQPDENEQQQQQQQQILDLLSRLIQIQPMKNEEAALVIINQLLSSGAVSGALRLIKLLPPQVRLSILAPEQGRSNSELF